MTRSRHLHRGDHRCRGRNAVGLQRLASLVDGGESGCVGIQHRHGTHGGYSTSRVAQLHAAAQCIRTHGIPSYQDPVLTADGQVYTDSRSILDFESAAGVTSGRQRQRQLLAGHDPGGLRHADRYGRVPAQRRGACPAKLVQAGVKLAQCLRANGLPNYRDPTSSTPFTPGHGFGITADELPNNGAGGKTDPDLPARLRRLPGAERRGDHRVRPDQSRT